MDYVRTWSATPAAVPPGAPVARSVTLFSPGAGCADPYFHSDVTPCNEVGVRARIDYGTLDRTKLKIFVEAPPATGRTARTSSPTTPPTGDWVSVTSKAFVPTAANGPQPITMSWKYKDAVTINGNGCSTGQGCSGTFEGGSLVQRSFAATDARSGPIRLIEVSQGANKWVNSLQRPTAGDPASVQPGHLRGDQGQSRRGGSRQRPARGAEGDRGSQNQSLNCDTGYTTSRTSSRTAAARRTRSTRARRTARRSTGRRSGELPSRGAASPSRRATRRTRCPEGSTRRILGDEKPTICTAPNNWSSFPNLPEGDPRVLQVFLTPFGAFSGSGNDATVRVTDFATFYITGWTGQGSGFDNPCEGNGDDPVPNNDPGTIVGHFIIYIDKLNTGGGSGITCSFTSLGTCVLVLTQ